MWLEAMAILHDFFLPILNGAMVSTTYILVAPLTVVIMYTRVAAQAMHISQYHHATCMITINSPSDCLEPLFWVLLCNMVMLSLVALHNTSSSHGAYAFYF